jgi:hypothetical protein
MVDNMKTLLFKRIITNKAVETNINNGEEETNTKEIL